MGKKKKKMNREQYKEKGKEKNKKGIYLNRFIPAYNATQMYEVFELLSGTQKFKLCTTSFRGLILWYINILFWENCNFVISRDLYGLPKIK